MLFPAEHIDLREVQFTAELLQSLPRHIARHYRALPVRSSPTSLCIALDDVNDLDTIDSLTFILKRPLEFLIADSSQLDDFILRLYGDGSDEVLRG